MNCIKLLEKEEQRTVKLNNDIVFLKRCRTHNLTPKGMTIKNHWCHIPGSNDLLKKAEQTLVKLQIHFKFAELEKLKKSISIKQQQLITLPPTVNEKVSKYMRDDKMAFNLQTKTLQAKKFDHLLRGTITTKATRQPFPSKIATHHDIEKSIVNLSHRELTEDETKALQLGLNYALPYFKHKDLIIEAGINIELCLNDFEITEVHKNKIRSGISRILHSEINKPDEVSRNYEWLKPICKNLKQDKYITIVPADKGNMTVILSTTKYDEKVQELLNDPNYTIIPTDPTKLVEQEIHTLIPKFYGLPKIHKDGVPFRPIVDFRNSPSYNLAHFLNKILKCVTSKFPTSLKNSYEFADKIKNFIVPPNHELVSFDVTSLFTRVPIQQTLNYIKKRLDSCNDWKVVTKLTSEEVMKLIRITVNSNYFTRKGNIYRQKDGTPMGSPISPVFAEFCLQELEEQLILNNPDIPFYQRFVDDSNGCIKAGKKDSILQSLNSFHPSIQFTCETEESRKLPFLDVLISRDEDGTIHRQVYRKPTHTGRYLNYNSFHHPSQKLAVIDALSYRAFKICDDEYLENELNLITSSLMTNGYPKNLRISN
ncbi:uncharacterized protein LOC110860936 [Folsomia candida]|uniref:uncharacterized protein LOC110860936 n=1 Tax=Folsomia candida TaxID=158441 RepID=UPI000B8FD4D7|nr:uncharacterized protein LOC110860936 [Folsomia candida]